MLGRLVVKMLFKACVPLIAVAGVSSYAIYLKGGDPASLLRQVGSGALGKASDSISAARNSAAALPGQLASQVSSGVGGNASLTEVFTWKDADGVTHFGSEAPAGINAQSMTVDPDINVVAPVAMPVTVSAAKPVTSSASSHGSPDSAYVEESMRRVELMKMLSGNGLTPASRE